MRTLAFVTKQHAYIFARTSLPFLRNHNPRRIAVAIGIPKLFIFNVHKIHIPLNVIESFILNICYVFSSISSR